LIREKFGLPSSCTRNPDLGDISEGSNEVSGVVTIKVVGPCCGSCVPRCTNISLCLSKESFLYQLFHMCYSLHLNVLPRIALAFFQGHGLQLLLGNQSHTVSWGVHLLIYSISARVLGTPLFYFLEATNTMDTKYYTQTNQYTYLTKVQ